MLKVVPSATFFTVLRAPAAAFESFYVFMGLYQRHAGLGIDGFADLLRVRSWNGGRGRMLLSLVLLLLGLLLVDLLSRLLGLSLSLFAIVAVAAVAVAVVALLTVVQGCQWCWCLRLSWHC